MTAMCYVQGAEKQKASGGRYPGIKVELIKNKLKKSCDSNLLIKEKNNSREKTNKQKVVEDVEEQKYNIVHCMA